MVFFRERSLNDIQGDLLIACQNVKLNKVKAIFEKNKKFHQELLQCTDQALNTPLHFAAINGHVHIVEYLLSQGADPKAENKYHHTAFDSALEYVPPRTNRVNALEILEKMVSAFCNSELKDRCLDLNEVRVDKVGYLGQLAKYGALDAAKILVDFGADLNLKDGTGKSVHDYSKLKDPHCFKKERQLFQNWLNMPQRSNKFFVLPPPAINSNQSNQTREQIRSKL